MRTSLQAHYQTLLYLRFKLFDGIVVVHIIPPVSEYLLRGGRYSFFGKGQLLVQGVDIGIFHAVHPVNKLLENYFEPQVIAPVQAGIGDCFKSTENFVGRPGAGVEGLDTVLNGPLDGGIKAHVKMQIFDRLFASPVAANQMPIFHQQHRHGDRD